ncbi:nitrogen fixation protein NifQ [Xanthobacter dioxanivorans]|uniref:Nitrogen fixation protein NifQ n=1 Tax=Xanthobacter dioxanivorans TaxID=2528964 RepID=A0A974SJB0_9HYPH|nr:nitrogen fixation protein NifQ [Xanthobacter dioxanivorans]QRG07600.1 nitrogen fixation protein NifQ [Xanthobacter dioxanivorans]
MTAEEVYDWLIASSTSSAGDAFDVHVAASIFAVAFAEAEQDGRDQLDSVGLERRAFLDLSGILFPAAAPVLAQQVDEHPVAVEPEEQSVRDILGIYSSDAGRLQAYFIAMIARRCQAPHHLWQDLGLRSREELRELMTRRFAPLAMKNRQDMKWKKFLYRMVCGSEGFTLCAAPVCSDCDEFHICFGAEDGESRLARSRNFGAANANAPMDTALLDTAPLNNALPEAAE